MTVSVSSNGYKDVVKDSMSETMIKAPANRRPMDDDSDDDMPLIKRKKLLTIAKSDSDSDDDTPLSIRKQNIQSGVVHYGLVQKVDAPKPSQPTKKVSMSLPKEAKREKKEVVKKPEVKKSISSDSDDDVPLALRLKKENQQNAPQQTPQKPAMPIKKEPKYVDDEEDSEDDIPLAQRAKNQLQKNLSSTKPVVKPERDNIAIPTKKQPTAKHLSLNKKAVTVKKEEKTEPNVTPTDISTKKKKKNIKTETEATTTAAAAEDANEFRWWEQANYDGTIKWQSLEHNGVFFPPDYVPHGVPFLYDGRPLPLSPAAEEVASFYAQMLDTEYVLKNDVFRRNFFQDFLKVLNTHQPGHPVKELSLCDFSHLYHHFLTLKDQKKLMTKEQKDAQKAAKLAIEDTWAFATVDGRREKVGNFRIEPPGLFRGRGAHPKAGCLKQRIRPEDVTINIGKSARIPDPPSGHTWGGVVHDNTVTWLATWTENVTGNIKYVFFAASSWIKGFSDMQKFEKARLLKKHIVGIRRDYTRDLKDDKMKIRQRATAMYLIDVYALRAGHEKDEDEADTVGCCSLRVEHVVFLPNHVVRLNFLGKDSIVYDKELAVTEQVYRNLKLFAKGKSKLPSDPLFDRLNTNLLNKHLKSLMPGLSAKVFRTFNASVTFQRELAQGGVIDAETTHVAEKLLFYNSANKRVAELCNHQRSIPKTHEDQMRRMTDKIRMLKWERRLVRTALMRQRKGVKVAEGLLREESDLDEEIVKELGCKLVEQRQKEAEKKREKEAKKEKTEQDGRSSSQSQETLLSSQGEVTPIKVETLEGLGVEKLAGKIEKLDDRIKALTSMKKDKETGTEFALGTSKINYLDPRISVAWCKKYGVPLEKIFNKSLRDKFKWAMNIDKQWEF